MPPPFTVHAGDDPGAFLGEWDHQGNIIIPGDLIVGGQVRTGVGFNGVSLSEEVDAIDARVTALEAFNSGTPGLVYSYGVAPPPYSPDLGNPMYFATDTGELWIPGGTSWYKVALTAQTLVSGGANPPTNFTAAVQPDNTTLTSWTLPTPPTGYTISAVRVREKFTAPNGLAGMPLAGTATSYTVPAVNTAATAEYYVTVTFSKAANPDVESAQSNHVAASYPFSGTLVTNLGQTTDSTSSSASTSDKTIVSKFTAAQSGIITAGRARLWVDSGSATVQMIAYGDSSGSPGSVLGLSDPVVITNTSEAQINFTFSGAQQGAVVGNSDYHIGFTWHDPGTNNISWSRDTVASKSSQSGSYAPNPFGTPSLLSGPIDAYVEVTSTGSGGGSLATPASILGIGSSSFWYLTEDRSGASELTPTCAQLAAGYVDNPYFYVNSAGDAVAMSTFANATTTQNSPHPRTELREMKPDGVTKAAWSAVAGATHRMFGTSTITHLPADAESTSTPKPQVCFAQIHDAVGDVVRLQIENSGSTPSDPPGGHTVANLHMVAHTHSPNGGGSTEVKTSIQSSYTIGTAINWMIEVIGTTCNIWIGGTITGTVGNWAWSGGTKVFTFTISGTGFYFKAGDYQQFSTVSTDGGYVAAAYAITELKRISVYHSSYA